VRHAEVTDQHFERRAELAPSVEPVEVRPMTEVRV
jgi:hypothetical protein